MTVSHFFYQLLIGPLELLMEVIYVLVFKYLYNCGLSIIALSLAVNTLLLPMHKRADAIQDEERELEKSLSHWVKHIKRAFHGDERTMMLQTYYKQNNYKPYYALKASLPLLLIIPFFIAAFHFLSNLQELNAMPFGPIKDLSAPDGLLVLSGHSINILPVVMTLINCTSSAVYSKDFTLREKIQLYGMALIFLVLLYNSPSGLVLYWTTNNLFSLVKNLFRKTKNSQKIIRIFLSAAGAAVIIFGVFFFHTYKVLFKLLLILFGFVLEIPLISSLLKNRINTDSLVPAGADKDIKGLFFAGCFFAAILTGLLIPSAVIVSSPAEFVLINDFYSPARHVLSALILSVGFFVIWLGIFYYLSNDRAKKVSCLMIWLFSGISIVNYMFFGTNKGTLSEELRYYEGLSFSSSEKYINLTVIIVLSVILVLLFLKKRKIIKPILLVLTTAILGMSLINIAKIQKEMPEIRHAIESSANNKARIKLNKNGQNVIVFMLDRGISSYLPYIFQENPDLARQFEGFTYYPNTLSFGTSTNFAAPALFGGYEYTPEELNKRTDESLEEKHNEALKVLPVLFEKSGYEVTVCDPVYAGYSYFPDISIYDDYPDINAYVTEHGQFNLLSDSEHISKIQHIWERNFFFYSLMKVSPILLQKPVYYSGSYLQANSFYQKIQTIYGLSKATGLNNRFINSYSVLCFLPEITVVSDDNQDTFLMMDNSTPHEAALLSEPEYAPAEVIDNTEYDIQHLDRFILDGKELIVKDFNQMTHYHVNMAALKRIGIWLDHLRDNDVFDNTRIIIVADHGRGLNQFEDMIFGTELSDDVMWYNPLLLVKDFGSTEFSVNYEYMTNADTPTLATYGLISNPINPFTGKEINNDAKYEPEQHVFYSTDWQPMFNNGNTFKPGKWYSVHDNIFDLNNWNYIGKH